MDMIIYVKYPHKSYIPSLITKPSSRGEGGGGGGEGDGGGGPNTMLEDFRMKPSFTLSLLKKDISRRMSIPISQISFLNNLPSTSTSSPSFTSASTSASVSTSTFTSASASAPDSAPASTSASASAAASSHRDNDSMTISQSGILPGTILELNTRGKIVLAVLRNHLKLVMILIVDPNTTIRDIKNILVDAPALRQMGEKPLSMALKRPWPTPGTMWPFDEEKRVGECMTDDQLDMGGVTFTVGDLRYADQGLE